MRRGIRLRVVAALGLGLGGGGLAAAPAGAGTVCVKAGGGGACAASIGEALASADAGDVIRVAGGTYTENVAIAANVTLEGGWSADLATRDPAAFPTTITPADPSQSVVSIQGDMANPAASTPVLDGFTITGGHGELGGSHGGGLRIRDSHATVRHCVIEDNTGYLFGGGVWVQRGAPRLEGNRIAGNTAWTDGGAALGGGVSLEGASAVLVDNEITGNGFGGPGPTWSGSGAGLSAAGVTVSVRGGRIADNVSGVPCTGDAGIYGTAGVDLSIEGVEIADNCGLVSQIHFAGQTLRVVSSLLVMSQSDADDVTVHVAAPGGTTFLNDTFVGDNRDGLVVQTGSLSLRNSIFVGHATALVSDEAMTLDATGNMFFSNNVDLKDVGGTEFPLPPGNLTVDPLLDASHRLTAASPAVDAGVPVGPLALDVDGEPRIADGGSGRFRIDIGADELAGPAQRVVDLDGAGADLTIRGPGNPPENPASKGDNDWIGYAVLASDVSGDGAADLVFSAEDWAQDFDTLNATGRIFGFRNFGARRTGTVDLASDAPDFQVVSELENQHVGETLAAADVNADGTADLVAGSAQNDNDPDVQASAFTLFGGASLASTGSTIAPGALGDFAVAAPEKSQLAFATENGLAAGDLDGDGIADLAIGDGLADDGALADTGAVFVVFGGAGNAGVRDLAAAPADFALYGPSANGTTFGIGPYGGGLSLGDLDGDGQTDLVARDEAAAHVLFGPLAAGARHLAQEPADVTVTGLAAGSVLVTDATGDGQDDLVLGSEKNVRVVAGPLAAGQSLAAAAAAAFTLTGAEPRSLAAGDLAGDERPELLLGDPALRRVYAVPPAAYGPGDVPVDEVAALVVAGSFAAARNLGWDVAAGDLDLDGRADLAAGAWQLADPAGQTDFQDIGKVFVVYGEAPLPPCRPAPEAGCIAAARGRLRVDERKAGKEKLKLGLEKLTAPVGAAELGDPVAGGTRYDVCLYDASDALVAALAVDRAGVLCGRKPCWKAGRAGVTYADPSASASGVAKLVARGGAAGKGKLTAQARNRMAKGQTALPTGLAAALADDAAATAQVKASDGACFELRDAGVRKAGPGLFEASLP